ncbi:uncharacterized protein BDZ83DRAFT_627563 [Colletotrichum acutatum]|uniref:Protein kinase domain-containing protein n=1 Tax=Glomerella acutata TaxID=27357 RepID=A0AAD8UJH9_GLOAC|nr:uncharacterized protein BDZ83DRAFT_627563 [Colletotrichum acutatum]KAK1722899.1 hypothetical protein BDZ83DRAFT_627563 [Colletotrichum acutatum]
MPMRLPFGNRTSVADEAVPILAVMSTAIAHVHSQGIVHNDVKPANSLFERIRNDVLIDLGLSSELKDTTIHVGSSPWYVRPE